jgi:ATP-dependent helicase/nuclease subunit A
MGENRWSAEQRSVIESRNENLLVSAAAGAGKTSVLVERILRLITQDGLDVDRLLVMTFTKDAASHMREKLADGLEKLILDNPDDRNLQRQQMLLHNASITTIDSFCSSVVREYFHEIDIDPAFRIGETAELVLMRNTVLDDLLEEYYAADDADFTEMVESFATSKNDDRIEELILKLRNAAEAQAWPFDWLDRLEAEFIAERDGRAGLKDEWKDYIYSYAHSRICDIAPMVLTALGMCRMTDGPAQYEDAISDDNVIFSSLTGAKNYTEFKDAITSFSGFSRLSSKKGGDEDLKERVRALRDDYKKAVADIKKDYFYAGDAEIAEELSLSAGPVITLIRITKEFMRRFAAAKKDKNVIDFGDLEHFTLEILADRDADGNIVPSHAAKELRDRFTDIFVDEYQDSNFVQEQMVNIIAGADNEKPLTFMVGDVKQSIYRFRMAKPELFMNRFADYRSGSGHGRVISLGRNFRSRPEVLDSTNDVFYKSMVATVGGIDYDEEAALVCGQRELAGGDMPVLDEHKTELIMLSSEDLDEESGSGADALRHLEARTAAARIKELIDSGYIIGKGTEKEHRIGYGDIVILLRVTKGWADCYTEELEAAGVPVFCDMSGGFLGSYEVTVMLNFLRILDNPRQDIPLAAVLRSEPVGMSNDELVAIRTFGGIDVPFWDSLNMYAKEGPADDVRADVNAFLALYNEICGMNLNRDIAGVIAKIYEKTGFELYCSALPGGQKRAANLEMLINYASEYEAGGYSGLFSFVRYLEQIITSEQDLEEAVNAEAGDSVRILTIHKSKGLEFPVVIVGGMGKLLRDKDASPAVIISSDYGIGTKYTDLVRRVRSDTLRRSLVRLRMENDYIGEELRLLYVAMTRAEQKLIMIGAVGTKEYKPDKWQAEADANRAHYPVSYIADAKCLFDFVYPAALMHPDDFKIVEADADERGAAGADGGDDAADDEKDIPRTREFFENIPDPGDSELRAMLNYEYPHADREVLPVKLSVSDIKHASMEEEGETAPWLGGTASGGAARGTIYHLVMQFIPFTLKGEGEVNAFLDSLEERAIIDSTERAMVKASDIAAFLDTDLAKRMAEADAAGHLRREQPFVLGRRACDIDPVRFAGEEEVIPVQGIIDCMFSENGRYVILDYKTDRVGSDGEEVLTKRYHAQLHNYAEAVSRITGIAADECVIYSFSLGKVITL